MTPHRILLPTAALLLSLLGSLFATPAVAQEVRGTVTGAASGAPVTGAFVSLLDSTGVSVLATLTNERGQYSLRARVPGSYSLRVERLALQPYTSSQFEVTPGVAQTRDLEVTEKAVALAPVTAAAERRGCRSFGDLDDETAALWEEARKALAIASWTAGQPIRLRVVRSLAERFAGSRNVEYAVDDSVARDMRGSPWNSAPAEELARLGFVRRHQSGYLYYGPDADVLLSDVFLAGHCFRAVRHPDSAGIVGLEFRPRGNTGVTDIQGTLWLHRETAELRWLDYQYVRLPYRIPRERVGGSARYQRLESGMWILSEWRMSAPRPLTGPGRQPHQQALLMSEHTARVVDVLHSNGRSMVRPGGEPLAEFVEPDRDRPDDIQIPGSSMPARLWAVQMCAGPPKDGRMHLVGSVMNAQRRAVGGANVLLISSMRGFLEDRTTTPDAQGLYRFCNAPAGQPYRVEVRAPGYSTAVATRDPAESGAVAGVRIVLEPN